MSEANALIAPSSNCQFSMAEIINDFSGETPYVFNVFFHKITDENGNTPNGEGDNIDEYEYLEAIRVLNIKYNRFNIFFKYYGYDTIKNSDFLAIRASTSINSGLCYTLPTIDDLITYCENNVNDDGEIIYKDNALNLFITQYTYIIDSGCTSANGSALGTAEYFSPLSFYKYKVFDDPDPNKPIEMTVTTVAHEVGHNFGLFHTNHNWDNPTPYLSNPDPNSDCDLPTYQYSEHVTRDESNSNYNAVTAGDYVADTFAAKKLTNTDVDITDCTYIFDPTYKDFTTLVTDIDGYVILDEDCEAMPNGEPYVDVQVTNFMNSPWLEPIDCWQYREFTDGQGTRMRCIIDSMPLLNEIVIQNDVSTLYDPYKGIYFTVGNYNEWVANPATFQPGFDYEFIECGDGTSEMYIEPTEYEDTSFTYTTRVQSSFKPSSQVPITHYNPSAIIIEQTHDPQPRKCWNNPTKGGSNGGSITKFNDNIINTNITIYPKDSLQINDANLIFDLEDGLYKIDKNYNDGSQEQTIIIKNNE